MSSSSRPGLFLLCVDGAHCLLPAKGHLVQVGGPAPALQLLPVQPPGAACPLPVAGSKPPRLPCVPHWAYLVQRSSCNSAARRLYLDGDHFKAEKECALPLRLPGQLCVRRAGAAVLEPHHWVHHAAHRPSYPCRLSRCPTPWPTSCTGRPGGCTASRPSATTSWSCWCPSSCSSGDGCASFTGCCRSSSR